MPGLRYIHCVHRLGEKILNESYSLGDFEPSRRLQTFSLPAERAPDGLFHIGQYNYRGRMLDLYNRELASFRWFVKLTDNNNIERH